jgi:hypothetical protein
MISTASTCPAGRRHDQSGRQRRLPRRLKWTHRLVVEDGVHPGAGILPPNDGNALPGMFAAEKIAMVHEDRSFQFRARNAVKDKFDFATIQFPRGPKSVGWATGGAGHCGTALSKYRDEAFTLVYAIADKRFAYLVGKFQGYLTGRTNNLDELGPYAGDPFIQLQFRGEAEAKPFWVQKNLRSFELEAALDSALDLVWLGKRQPDKQFTQELKKTLDEILAKPVD